MPPLNNNLTGILSALGAAFLFSFMDMSIKFLSESYALHQIVVIRASIGMIVLFVVVAPFYGGLALVKTRRLKTHLLRGLCVVTANVAFFLAIAAMPLADAVAIFFVAPPLITIMSVVFLHESVGLRRWVAICVGLIGVVIIMRPGSESFKLVALLPLIAALGYSTLHILTRKLGPTEHPVTMTFYIQLIFILVSLLIGLTVGDGRLSGSGDPSLEFLFRRWVPPKAGDLILFLAIGLSSTGGAFLISLAYSRCEAGLAASFEYVALPLSVFWGIVVFADWPDGTAILGITLIVSAGLYMFWREALSRHQLVGDYPPRPD